MQIRNNSVGGGGQDHIDLTKANRDSIRERNPNPPVQPKPVESDEFASTDAKRIAGARDQFEQAASVHKRVEGARERFSVHKRIHAARERFAVETPEDQVTLSGKAQELAETATRPKPSDVDSAARAQRISDLKAKYENGELDVESLVAETAYRMLSED